MKAMGEVDILLIEDSPGDARLMKEALAEAKIRNRLHIVADGLEALAFLRRQDMFAGAFRPDLILLDLNLPGKDGREVRAEIKRAEDLRRIPIVILTTSQAEADVAHAYDLHAKPGSTETNSHLGRGCERSVRWLLRALGHASTDALPRVLVAAFGSSRPASQSASSARWIRAKAYVTKPLDIERFITVVKSIEDFSLTIVKLPK